MIRFDCPACRTLLRVPPDLAGTTADCPRCGTAVTAPGVRAFAEADGPGTVTPRVVVALPPAGEDHPAHPPALLPPRVVDWSDPGPAEERRPLPRHDDDGDYRAMRRPRGGGAKVRLALAVAAIVVSSVVILACVVILAGRRAGTGVAAATTAPRASARGDRPVPPQFPAGVTRPPARPTLPPRRASPAADPPPDADAGETTDLRIPKDRPDPFPARPTPPAAATPEPREGPAAPFASDRPAREVFDGYYLRKAHGFSLYVSRLAYEESDARRGEPLRVIDGELETLARIFPPSNMKVLAQIAVWVEWDHRTTRSRHAIACYYGTDGAWLAADGVDPRKANGICVLTLKEVTAMRGRGAKSAVLLHEVAHAVHHKLLGFDNPAVENAYRQAVTRGLYTGAKDARGGAVARPYLMTSPAEYFAELTCAYLDRLDYTPFDAPGLREWDSVGYELMAKVWGTPEQIEAARRRR